MGVKILFFSRGILGQNSMFPEKGGQNSIFFPVSWKREVKTAEPTNQLHWRGAPPGYVYGVEMYKLVNSEQNWMNEKQVKLTEFMIAFEKKSPLILISATAMKVTFMKKHPEASVLSILKLASPLSMHNATRVKHFI